jgi:lysophospholipase L1-like esterase
MPPVNEVSWKIGGPAGVPPAGEKVIICDTDGTFKQMDSSAVKSVLGAGVTGIAAGSTPKASSVAVLGGVGWKQAGDSLASATLSQNMFLDLERLIQRELAGSFLAGPTAVTRSGVAGQKSDAFAAGVVAQAITGTADGDVFFISIGVNDIVGVAPNPDASATASNLNTVLAAITAARPNSPILVAPIVCASSEAWSISAGGVPQGGGSNDGDVQDRNSRMATVCAGYPKVRFLRDMYGDFYAYAAAANTANSATQFATADGIHPGDLGRRIFGESGMRQIYAAFRNVLPTSLVPWGRHDNTFGDWLAEVRDIVQSFKAGGLGAPAGPGVRFDFREIPIGMAPQAGAFPAGMTDGGLLGGAVALAPAAPFMFSTKWLPSPGNTPFVLAMQVSFNAQAGGREALIGLQDDTTGANGLFFGIANGDSATKWVMRERKASANTPQVSSVNSDTNRHTVLVHSDGGFTLGGTIIYDVYVDRTQVFHVNPTGNFPAVALGLGMPAVATGGIVTLERMAFGFQRTRT